MNIKNFVQYILGVVLIVTGFSFFLLPHNLVGNGILGLSLIIKNYININPVYFILFTNILFFIFGLIFLESDNIKKSFFTTFLIPFLIFIVNYFSFTIYTNDILLASIFGGISIGLGYGLIYKIGFNIGGFDILEEIINKYWSLKTRIVFTIINATMLVLSFFAFGLEKTFCSLIVIYIITYLSKKIIVGIGDAKAFYIITNKEKEVKEYIIKDLKHDVTVIDVEGGFSTRKTKILLCVISTREYYRLREGIKIIDPTAFITITDSYEVMNKNVMISKNNI